MSIVSIRNRATEAVAGLFGLHSNQGVRELDNGPAQPVYDITRLAELASGQGAIQGYVELVATMVHAGAGDLFSNDAVDTVVGIVGNISKDRAWLMNVAADEGTAGIGDEVMGTVNLPASPGTPLGRIYACMHSATVSGLPSALGGVVAFVPNLLFNEPWFMPRGTFIRSASNASGAGTMRIFYLFWVGPIGSRPPGV